MSPYHDFTLITISTKCQNIKNISVRRFCKWIHCRRNIVTISTILYNLKFKWTKFWSFLFFHFDIMLAYAIQVIIKLFGNELKQWPSPRNWDCNVYNLTCNSSDCPIQVCTYKAWYMSSKTDSDHVDGAHRGAMFLKRSVIIIHSKTLRGHTEEWRYARTETYFA